MDHYSEGPALWEVNFAAGSARVVPLILPGGADPGLDSFPALQGAAILDAGEAVVAAFPNSTPGGGNLNDFRPQGVTDATVALTYRLGCN